MTGLPILRVRGGGFGVGIFPGNSGLFPVTWFTEYRHDEYTWDMDFAGRIDRFFGSLKTVPPVFRNTSTLNMPFIRSDRSFHYM